MSKIVSRARQVRIQHSLKAGRIVSAREVAEEIGVTEATLSRIEQGKTERIDFETLRKLCDYYDVEVGAILERTNEETKRVELESALLPAV